MGSTDPVDRLTARETRTLLKEIREILWPADDPDEPWSPNTIAAIGDLIEKLRPPQRRAPAPDCK